MKNITYKNFVASVHFDVRDQIFVGRLIGVSEIISFHSTLIEELPAAMANAIEDFLLDSLTLAALAPESRAGGTPL